MVRYREKAKEPTLAMRGRIGDEMATTRLFTGLDLLEMGDDAPFELIDGELREMSPASPGSSIVAGRVFAPLMTFVDDRRLGYVTVTDGGYFLRHDPDTVVAPDVGFIRRDRVPAGFTFNHYFPVCPDLAVEVLSPSNRAGEVADKVARYLRAGVRLVWVLDPVRQSTVVHRADGSTQTLNPDGDLDGEDVVPGFRLPLAHVFRAW